MPAKTIATPAKKTAPAKATAPASTGAAVDWDNLPAATVATYTRSASQVDREQTTPAPIKIRVKSAFEASAKASEPVWFVQQCGTVERAEEFVKLARLYARFIDVTFRVGTNATPGEVRYSVRVKETRKPKAAAGRK